jgi:sulfur-oxidizing protein SoxX
MKGAAMQSATSRALLAGPVLALALAGCAAPGGGGADAPSDAALDSAFRQMMAASFRDEGIATVARLQQDPADAACSRAAAGKLSDEEARRIEQESRKTIRLPADGRFLGDWKAGEALAQNGRGMTWSDKSSQAEANGGGCYNCHQLSPGEIAFGTIGPSLSRYARAHGVTDPDAPSARAALEYAWGKLYNSRASNACSVMPRFGHAGLLNERQLKDLMALLFDPASPVNH